MPEIENAIYSRLTGYAGLTALIGSGANCRLYPVVAQRPHEMPYVIYTRVAEDRFATHDSDPTLQQTSFSFECVATTDGAAAAVALQVYDALVGFQGIAAGVMIQGILMDAKRYSYDEAAGAYLVDLDMKVWSNL